MAGTRGNKRKRGRTELEQDVQEAPLSQFSPTVSQLPGSPSQSEDSEQSEQDVLDSFQEATAAPVEAFNVAAAEATAFLQPSQQMSGLARQAAKVCFYVLL